MGNRLFVGNLSYNTNEASLSEIFAKCGSITSTKIITDRETGQSRGFGFVEFATDSEAAGAMESLNGALLDGRPLAVKEAEARPPRQSGGGGGYTSRPSSGGYSSGGYSSGGGGYAASPPPELPPTGGRNKGGGGKQRRDRDRSDRDY